MSEILLPSIFLFASSNGKSLNDIGITSTFASFLPAIDNSGRGNPFRLNLTPICLYSGVASSVLQIETSVKSEMAVILESLARKFLLCGVGVGVGEGVALGTETPLFHTSFFPERMQV